MRKRFCLLLAVLILTFSGCTRDAVKQDKRDIMLEKLESQNDELKSVFGDEINVRNEYRLLDNPNLMKKQEYLDEIKSLLNKRIKAETVLAENLQKYYRIYPDENAYSQVLRMFIKPRIQIIHDLKRFRSEITRKQVISEMLEEYKSGNIPEKQMLRVLEDYKKDKSTKYLENSPLETESAILYNEFFERQYAIIEEFIGSHLTVLQKYFGDFEEVREIDNEIVSPYYKNLISSLPANIKVLTAKEKKVFQEHLEKIVKLFPYSALTVKAERKLIPLTAKKEFSELNGVPLVFFLLILLGITAGYTFCMRGFLRNKQPEQVESKVFKPLGSQQISSIDSDFNTQTRMPGEDV